MLLLRVLLHFRTAQAVVLGISYSAHGESHQFPDFDKMEFYMKAFNKLFSLVVASVLVFSLAGCGDKEESKKFSANLNGTEIAITYVYKGDKVIKQSSETKIQFATIGATTKEDAAKNLIR